MEDMSNHLQKATPTENQNMTKNILRKKRVYWLFGLYAAICFYTEIDFTVAFFLRF